MLRPRKDKPSGNSFPKFVRMFSLLMTLLYVALGLFIIFADARQLNLDLPQNIKLILGGIMILYGAVRFVRVYKRSSQTDNNRYDD